MAVKNAKGHWRDSSGDFVPAKYVSPIERLRDQIVEKHLNRAQKFRRQLEKWKGEVYDDIDKYFAKERELYGKDSSNPGQNKWFPDFANQNRIDMAATQGIEFDDRVWIARDKLMEYVEDAATGGKDAEGLKVVISNAYATNKFGKLDNTRIMSLLPLAEKINHPKVTEACDIIQECIRKLDRKVNIRFQSKDGKTGKWEPIVLDFSRM